jgi:hypothetical protein
VLRPRLKMPMWAAVAVVAAAYVLRSFLRGWDFRADMPIDAVLGAALVVLLLLRWRLSAATGTDEPDTHGGEQVHQHDDAPDQPGEHDEL